MDIEKLKKFEKLPPDVKRQLAIYMAKWKDKKKQADIKNDFMAFVKHVWPDFIEGKHHKEVAEKFNQIAQGKTKRVIINMAPRHTKSEFASYLLPAWMVGRNPKLKIIQSTNTTELSVRELRQEAPRHHCSRLSMRSTRSLNKHALRARAERAWRPYKQRMPQWSTVMRTR